MFPDLKHAIHNLLKEKKLLKFKCLKEAIVHIVESLISVFSFIWPKLPTESSKLTGDSSVTRLQPVVKTPPFGLWIFKKGT